MQIRTFSFGVLLWRDLPYTDLGASTATTAPPGFDVSWRPQSLCLPACLFNAYLQERFGKGKTCAALRQCFRLPRSWGISSLSAASGGGQLKALLSTTRASVSLQLAAAGETKVRAAALERETRGAKTGEWEIETSDGKGTINPWWGIWLGGGGAGRRNRLQLSNEADGIFFVICKFIWAFWQQKTPCYPEICLIHDLPPSAFSGHSCWSRQVWQSPAAQAEVSPLWGAKPLQHPGEKAGRTSAGLYLPSTC